MPTILTIGAYGFSKETFADALRGAGVDLLVDIRQRRGVRGAKYAFANKTRLEALLTTLGIRYVHVPALAPTSAVREVQQKADEDAGVAKRERTALTPAFVQAYTAHALSNLDVEVFLRDVVGSAQRVAFFCVETEPMACHRSLVAERIGKHLKTGILHLHP